MAMIRQLSVAITMLFAASSSLADHDLAGTQALIDRTVWRLFQQAFESLDGSALNALYADRVLRVTPGGIDTTGQFKITNTTRFDANKANGDRISLDFWFDHRHTNAQVSYEVGFYRLRQTTPDGSSMSFYGQFHIVLRNIDGRWKIVQDWDTDSIAGRAITAEHFNRKQPVHFSQDPSLSPEPETHTTELGLR